MEKENKRKLPLFWVIYAAATLATALVIGLLLNRFYAFLEAYEATRPMHEADKVIASVFQPDNRETLKELITNKVENGIETEEGVLDLFYKSIEGKELTYGRYYGKYTDEKPQYIVSAGDEQVASIAFKATKKYNKRFGFKLWELESVTLMLQPKYGYAVTIPETMTLYVNGTEIPKTAATGHKDSDCKVGYLEYSGAGFYEEPKIVVKDRIGQEVSLLQDEATGGYYYLLHYAYAPSDTVVSFNGTKLTANEVMESGIDSGVDFLMVKEVIKKYSEYKCLEDSIVYPTFVKYYVDINVDEKSEYSWTNKLDTMSPVTFDSNTRTFSCELANDEKDKEELVSLVTKFVETFTLFCSNDKKITELQKYFPAESEYYEKISHLNNSWFKAHSNTSFKNHETKEYFAYADNLAYVYVYMEQTMKRKSTGLYETYAVTIPVWMVKIEGKWYVGAIDFDKYVPADIEE